MPSLKEIVDKPIAFVVMDIDGAYLFHYELVTGVESIEPEVRRL